MYFRASLLCVTEPADMNVTLKEVDGSLAIPASWCDIMAERVTCSCTWANLFPVDIEANNDTGASILDWETERHELSVKLDSWLEGVILPIIALIGTIGRIIIVTRLGVDRVKPWN